MTEVSMWILLGMAVLAYGMALLGMFATVKHTRKRTFDVASLRLPPITLLKPLKGLEEALESNLESFFEQDYPAPIQIIFATTDPDDDALPVARRVASRHPDIDVVFVLSDPNFGLNPKVSNLRGALDSAKYDLVWQSDANVRVGPDSLRRLASEMIASDASLLSSLVVGTGERSIGAALENLQLSAMITPSMCFALRYFGVACVIGKSMLFRKSELAGLGGLERVKDVLAEDFFLGRMYEAAGKRVALSSTVAQNVNERAGIARFMARHARWLKMRAVIHRPAFVADVFGNPVGLAFVAVWISGFDLRAISAFIALAFVKTATDAWMLRRTRGEPMRFRHLLLAPFKDVLLLAIWPHAAVSRSIHWRGARLRMGKNSVLRPDEGRWPIRLARRLLRVFSR
jgi:ceramide glucosyltransferase